MITTVVSSSKHKVGLCILLKSYDFSAFVHSWFKVTAKSPCALETNKCWDFKGTAGFVREENSEPKSLEGQGQTTMGSLVYKTILLLRA